MEIKTVTLNQANISFICDGVDKRIIHIERDGRSVTYIRNCKVLQAKLSESEYDLLIKWIAKQHVKVNYKVNTLICPILNRGKIKFSSSVFTSKVLRPESFLKLMEI